MNLEEPKQKKTEDTDAAPRVVRDLRQSVSETPQELHRRRNQRIQDHLRNVLDSSDTLQACMGPICCDLLEVCQELKRLLDERIRQTPSTTGSKESCR